jgi:aminoglycoside phosphotransferase (APT) family kinase protein
MDPPRLRAHWHVWTIQRAGWGDQSSWSREQLDIDRRWAEAVREAGLEELLDEPEKMEAWLAAHSPDEEPSSES